MVKWLISIETDETNLKLDEQKGNEAGVRHALAVEHKEQESLEREKREAAEPLNNDQKFDDQDAALQEGNNNIPVGLRVMWVSWIDIS